MPPELLPANHLPDHFKQYLTAQQLAMVEFKAEWSGGSHLLSPIVKKLASTYQNELLYISLDADQHQALTRWYGIEQFPTLLLLQHGQVADQITGIHSEAAIAQRINQLITPKNNH